MTIQNVTDKFVIDSVESLWEVMPESFKNHVCVTEHDLPTASLEQLLALNPTADQFLWLMGSIILFAAFTGVTSSFRDN